MAEIIDGKRISQEIKDELKERVAQLKQEGKEATLAVIQVGSDPASSVYVNNKKKACAYVGIRSLSYELPEETTETELLDLIDRLNNDDTVNGILVQLPLPKHIKEDLVIQSISPAKDVDGFPSGKRGTPCHRRKGICFLHTGRNHPAVKALRYRDLRQKLCRYRQKQHCRQTDGTFDAP